MSKLGRAEKNVPKCISGQNNLGMGDKEVFHFSLPFQLFQESAYVSFSKNCFAQRKLARGHDLCGKVTGALTGLTFNLEL